MRCSLNLFSPAFCLSPAAPGPESPLSLITSLHRNGLKTTQTVYLFILINVMVHTDPRGKEQNKCSISGHGRPVVWSVSHRRKNEKNPAGTLSQRCLSCSRAAADCTRKCKSYDRDQGVKPRKGLDCTLALNISVPFYRVNDCTVCILKAGEDENV